MIDILVRILSAVLMMGMPIGFCFYLRHKLGASWRFLRIGAMTFIVSQVFHIPFNMVVLPVLMHALGLESLFNASGTSLVILAIFLGLSAGVFEEVSRYLVYRYWLTSSSGERTWKNAITLGAGHGGCESFILGILAVITLIQMIVLRHADLSKILPPDKIDQAQQQIEHYWSLSWYEALLPAVERVSAMAFHVAASVLVLQVFCRNNILWLVAAIVFHTIIDTIAAVGLVQKWDLLVVEIVLAVTVIPLASWIIVHFRQDDDDMTSEQGEFQPIPQREDTGSEMEDPSLVSE